MESAKSRLREKLQAFARNNDFTEVDERDFVVGVISNAKIDENYQRIIEFMDEEDDVSVEEIIYLSLMLGKGIDPFRDTFGAD